MAAVRNFDPSHTERMEGSNTEEGMREERPTGEGDDNGAELRLRPHLFPSNPPSEMDSTRTLENASARLQ